MADGGPGRGRAVAAVGRPLFGRALATAARLPARILADMAHDLAARRGFLWIPVAFGGGSALYFVLPAEPPALVPPALTALGLAVVWLARRRAGPASVAVAIAALATVVLLGATAAKFAVDRAAAPVFGYARAVTVTGWVETVVDREERGLRLLLRVTAIDPPPREGLPRRARVTLRAGTADPAPGETWTMLARLGPPQPPLYPGGYDFARAAWFERIGAVGFALGTPTRLEAPAPTGRDGWWVGVERLRATVSDRIRATVGGDAGAIAAALIVGDRGAIGEGTDEAMRISGLSHVLSISGLHMALVAGLVFGGARAAMALVPTLALRAPIKSIAAALALAATLAYLLVAGLNLPTQRSAVMIAVALAATMLGRRAVTLRTVAVAALVVLVLQPAAVLDPGAQMSFAAVIALAAAFEALAARRDAAAVTDRGDVSPVARAAAAAALWVGLSMLTSLVAGLATAPMALHHFNRVAPLGLVANLVASPVIAFLIMPAGLIAALLMPLGLDGPPLVVMGWGIEAMMAIAEAVAAATPSGGTVGRPLGLATLLISLGGLWICLWTRSARLPGIPLLVAGFALLAVPTAPDLVIAGDGGRALLRLPDGETVVLGRADAFETSLWLAARGDPRKPTDPALVRRVRCDPEACTMAGPLVLRTKTGAREAGDAPGARDTGSAGDPGAATSPAGGWSQGLPPPVGRAALGSRDVEGAGDPGVAVSPADGPSQGLPPPVGRAAAGARDVEGAGDPGVAVSPVGGPRPESSLPTAAARMPVRPEVPAEERWDLRDRQGSDRMGGNGRPGEAPFRAALVRQPFAFADECPEVDLVVTGLDAPTWCRALTLVIDAGDLAGAGTRTYALTRHQDGSRWTLDPIARSIPAVRRPWQNGEP